jgi:hypothetical protein
VGFGDFLNSVFGDVAVFIGEIVRFLQALLVLLIQLFVFLWNAIVLVAQYALNALKATARFFAHLWKGFFNTILPKVLDVIRKVHKWLESHLRPVINWLKKAQVWMEHHVWAPLRAYIQFLQRIRRYLLILRLLHIKWAEKLDQRLSRTESELAHTFLLVRGYFNQIISWVNAASDPLRLGRMVLAATFGRRMTAAVVRVITGLPIGFFFPHEGKGSHLYEQKVHSASALTDPRRNPPASDILFSLSPLPVDGFTSDDPTPSDAEIDGLETTPYFDSLFTSVQDMDGFFDGLAGEILDVIEASENRVGVIYDAASPVAGMLEGAL